MWDDRDFQKVYDEHFEFLLFQARKKLSGCGEMYHSAEDYVHEAFLRLYAEWDNPKVHENTVAWLVRVLNNCIISDFRRQNVRNRLLGKRVGLETAEYIPLKSAGRGAGNQPCGRLFELRDVLERELNAEEYLLFSLRYLFENSYAQISEKMGISLPMVGRKIWMLKKKLRAILKDEM